MAKYFRDPPSLSQYDPQKFALHREPAPMRSVEEIAARLSELQGVPSGEVPSGEVPSSEVSSAASVSPAARLASTGAASAPGPKRGIRERSPEESWARGLTVVAAGMALIALMSVAGVFLFEAQADRAVVQVIATGLVLLGALQARRALADPDQGPLSWQTAWNRGGALLALGLALFALLPRVW